jgi:hypothetical protein
MLVGVEFMELQNLPCTARNFEDKDTFHSRVAIGAVMCDESTPLTKWVTVSCLAINNFIGKVALLHRSG